MFECIFKNDIQSNARTNNNIIKFSKNFKKIQSAYNWNDGKNVSFFPFKHKLKNLLSMCLLNKTYRKRVYM